jgi:uncharacterized Zn finger protein
MKTSFFIQGSAAEPYELEFEKIGSNLRASCNCPAGAMHQFCKHILHVLRDAPEVTPSTNNHTAADVRQWLVGSTLEKALEALKYSEAALATAKANTSQAKRNASAAMHG